MRKNTWLKSWPRFLLWSHVIGVVGLYLVIWLRTAPNKEDRVKKLPPRSENPPQAMKGRLYVLRLRDDLPEGWAGKPHAIQKGTQEARGKWLLFTDADTYHAPNALRSSLAQAIEEKAGLFTIGSTQELPAFWDKVLMPMVYLGISMLYPPKLVNNPRSKVAIANGQY